MIPTPKIRLGESYRSLADGTIRERFVLVEGRRGTGKTRAILSIILALALRYPGSRWVICRSTRTRLTETVLVTLEQQVFPAFGMPVPGGAGRENRHAYHLPNGSAIIAMGLDDPQRGQSAECAGIYVSEGVELAKLDDVTALAGMMRQDVPTPKGDVPLRHQCIVDCNPGAPGHWLNQVAEPIPKEWRTMHTRADYDRLVEHTRKPAPEGKWKRVVSQHMDNPAYFDVKAWTWTRQGDEYLQTLGYLSGHLRMRWMGGLWCSAEGTVYPEFDEDKHVVDDFPVPPTWPHALFYDPGYDHPTCILWIAIGPNGCYYVVDEIYQGGRGVEAHALDVLKHNRDHPNRTIRRYYGDPQHAFSETAQSPESIAAQFKKATGITMSPWPRSSEKGAKEAMVNTVRRRLIGWPATDDDGKPVGLPIPRLKVFRSCTNTAGEFQSWSYKRNTKGQQLDGDDQFEDANNHAMDCLCGAAGLNLQFDWKTTQVLYAK